MRFLALIILALALGCTTVKGRPGDPDFEVQTFGSARVEIKASDGTSVTASGDGTNVFKIFSGLWKAIGSVFGAGQAGNVIVNVPAPAPAQE